MNASTSHAMQPSHKIHVMRLRPGQDLRKSLQEFATLQKLKAAVMVTCVGSLVQYNLRFANQKEATLRTGHFEIVSLVGTLSESSVHLHLCVSDDHGRTTGGHLMDGNLIFTTAEIAIAEPSDLIFERIHDNATGYKELKVIDRAHTGGQ
jgi:uncharacterized protein